MKNNQRLPVQLGGILVLFCCTLVDLFPTAARRAFTPQPTTSIEPPANQPPQVRILSPPNNGTFDWNANIRYAISVSDAEDGTTEYQEINANEVFLEVVYWPDASKTDAHLREPRAFNEDPAGLALIKTSDCFNCHAFKTKVQGPAFSEIAKRYLNNPNAAAMLAKRVRQGNSGEWGSAVMPAHPGFNEQQTLQITRWILENANDPNRTYLAGAEGAFRTQEKPTAEATGAYVLTASYADHGSKDKTEPSQTGRQTIVLRSR